MAPDTTLCLAVTIGAYAGGVSLQRLARGHPLVNPTLIGILGVAAVLPLLGIEYAKYFAGAQPIHWLLGPAVVALAVPLHRHFALVRARAQCLLAALVTGSLFAVGSTLVIGWSLGLSYPELMSVAPKSTTAAVSMEIARQIGGVPAITAVLTILAGITGAVIASPLLNVLGIRDPSARGFGMGLASHGIATARAFQESETAGTFAGLAMALNAVATAVLTPAVVRLIHW
jgi:predicted murein hydrolase (TIGR00659 family)